jgi:hypothetical protein
MSTLAAAMTGEICRVLELLDEKGKVGVAYISERKNQV